MTISIVVNIENAGYEGKNINFANLWHTSFIRLLLLSCAIFRHFFRLRYRKSEKSLVYDIKQHKYQIGANWRYFSTKIRICVYANSRQDFNQIKSWLKNFIQICSFKFSRIQASETYFFTLLDTKNRRTMEVYFC